MKVSDWICGFAVLRKRAVAAPFHRAAAEECFGPGDARERFVVAADGDAVRSDPGPEQLELMPGTDQHTGYGEEVTTKVDHKSNSPQDCLAWAAVVFSTSVQSP